MVDESPTRDERVKETIRQMGPAVFNGGFSTFLAFALLRQVKYNMDPNHAVIIAEKESMQQSYQ